MRHIIPGWDIVEQYKSRLSIEAIERAILEADKILVVIAGNTAKQKMPIDEVIIGMSQGSGIDVARLREIAHAIKNIPGYVLSDMYRGMDILDRYEALLRYVLNAPIGTHDTPKSLQRFRVWYFLQRATIKKITMRLLIVVGVILFATDTPLGRAILYFVVDQIHTLLIGLIFLFLFIVLIFTIFVIFSSAVDSLRKKTKQR